MGSLVSGAFSSPDMVQVCVLFFYSFDEASSGNFVCYSTIQNKMIFFIFRFVCQQAHTLATTGPTVTGYSLSSPWYCEPVARGVEAKKMRASYSKSLFFSARLAGFCSRRNFFAPVSCSRDR